MTNTLNLMPEDFDAISTVFEPVVLQGYGVYFKPKYEAINEMTWARAVESIQKEIKIVAGEAQEGTVYILAEKTDLNDVKALQIAAELLKRQTTLFKESIINGDAEQIQTAEAVSQNQMPDTSVQPQEVEALQSQDADILIYGTLENKAGWMNALHASFNALPLQSDDGNTVMAMRPREQNINSLAYMKAVNDLGKLVPSKLALINGQRFLLAKSPEVQEKFTKIALDLYEVQNQPLTREATVQHEMPAVAGNRVVLKRGNVLNSGSVFGSVAAPVLQRRRARQ